MSPRLFFHVAALEARKRMVYRLDFWVASMVGLLVQIGIAYLVTAAVFSESGRATVGGYTFRALVAYYVLVGLVGRLVTATEMEMGISQEIYEGGLTRYLLYPVSYAGAKYAQQLGGTLPALVQVTAFGAWMPFAFGWPPGMDVSSALMGGAAILLATLLQFLLLLPVQLVSFWADNVWSLVVGYRLVSRLLGGLFLPLALFPEGVRRALDPLPFKYLFAFPVDALLGRLTWAEWGIGMATGAAWCLAAAAVGTVVWKRGDLRYTGVGI